MLVKFVQRSTHFFVGISFEEPISKPNRIASIVFFFQFGAIFVNTIHGCFFRESRLSIIIQLIWKISEKLKEWEKFLPHNCNENSLTQKQFWWMSNSICWLTGNRQDIDEIKHHCYNMLLSGLRFIWDTYTGWRSPFLHYFEEVSVRKEQCDVKTVWIFMENRRINNSQTYRFWRLGFCSIWSSLVHLASHISCNW